MNHQNSSTDDMISDIVRDIIAEAGGGSEPILFLASADEGVLGYALFKENEDTVEEIDINDDPSSEAGDVVTMTMNLWRQWPKEQRWVEMELLIQGSKFEIRFIYPGAFDAWEDYPERRDAAVKRYFGDKPVIYPPWDEDDAFEL